MPSMCTVLEHEAHRVDGGLVGGLLVAHADEARRRQGGGLGHAHELQGEVAVGAGGAEFGHARN